MKRVTTSVSIVLLFSSVAVAYDTGSMSCEDIGTFAAATVEGKGNGATYKQALAKVDKVMPTRYVTERKNCKKIVKVTYKEPFGKNLNKEGAYAAMKADCEAQK
jgi:hypothetical protein